MDADYPKRPGRAHVVRCRLEARDDGWHVRPTKDQGSHVLTSMLGAEALAYSTWSAGTWPQGSAWRSRFVSAGYLPNTRRTSSPQSRESSACADSVGYGVLRSRYP